MRLILLSFLLILAGSRPTAAQDFSNKGKEFWLAYSYHVGMVNAGGAPSMNLYITSDVNTTYTVEIYGGAVISTGTITANVMTTVSIPNTYFVNNDGLFTARAIHITAAKPIVVYSFITRNAASAASLCLPANVLGKQYYAMSFTQVSNESNSNSYITIVAAEDNTTVEIIPTANTKGGWLAGSINNVNLNKGEVYQVLGTTTGNSGVDLSGTSVRSVSSGSGGCKRIAVFSGSGKVLIGGCSNGADNLYQQLYPASTWGKKYVTVPSFNKPNNYYRIMRSSAAANITLNGALIPAGSFTNGYYQFFNNTPNVIESDLPISVTQYFTTQNCGGNGSPYDPDMVVLNPVEQNINAVTLASSPLTLTNLPHEHHLHIVIPNGGAGSTALSSFLLDGVPVPVGAWVTHPADPNYSYLYRTVSQGSHSLYSDTGFNAIAYGYADFETYAYSAGTNVKDLYQQIGVQTLYGIENTPSVCTGSPFKFKISLPYRPDSMYWDFHGFQTPNVLVNSPSPVPVDSTTVINGKTIYWFSIPTLYTYPTVGFFPVTITTYAANSEGCGNEQQIDFDLEVSDPPIANFGWTTTVCAGGTVQFTDLTPVVPKPTYRWWWNFGDPASGAANTSTLRNPTHTFTTAGTYNVRYSAITTPGCLSDTITRQIVINPLPTASISGNASVCRNAPSPNITFTGIVGTAPFTFTYTLNGGANQTITTTTGNSVTIAVPTATIGTYTYALVSVQDGSSTACMQAQTGSVTVTVLELPTASVSGTTAVCINAPTPSVTFTAATAGTPPYTFIYNINGGPNLSVTTASGSSVSVPVPTSAAGTYTYSLVSVQDATSTLCSQPQTGTATIIVNPRPTASIAGSTSVCLNAPSPQITFTGAGATAPYTFSYTVNGNPQTVTTTTGNTVTVSVPTNAAGTFTYTLVSVTDGSSTLCSQLQAGSATVTVFPLPTVDFSTSNPLCQVRDINFTDLSAPNAGSLTEWSWNFGDPASGASNTSTLQHPTHTFATSGNYTITLSVKTSNGCVNTPPLQRVITINSRPRAGFINPQLCLTDSYAQFTDTSSVTPGTVTAWQWNFGDPGSGALNTSTAQNPQHSYNSVGPKTATLIATTNSGCRDTVTQTFVVNGDIPVSVFSINNVNSLCANDSVRLVNSSSVNVGSIIRVELYWDNIGQPGVFETHLNPGLGEIYSHLYPNFQTPATQSYQIRYRAYSGATCIDDRFQTITLHATPKVQFDAIPNTCLNIAPFQLTQAFEINGIPGSSVYSGPGVSSSGIFDPVSVGPGIYTIKYKFTNVAGCSDSASQQIRVLQPPVADFSISAPECQRAPILFNPALSVSPAGTLTTWSWNFGDLSPTQVVAAGTPITHTYTSTGNYTITLQVTTNDGCRSIPKTRTVNVQPQPAPAFDFTPSVCLPVATVHFNNSSSIADGSENTFIYNWNFDDPASGVLNTSGAMNPDHTYFAVGPYQVTLNVISGAGCKNDTTITVDIIHPKPKANFDFNRESICIGEEVFFHDLSDPTPNATIESWHWNLGDNTTASVPDGSHNYLSVGVYDVSLYIVNSFGCYSDTLSKPYRVYPLPALNLGPDRTLLSGGSITLQPLVISGDDLTYSWMPDLYLSNNHVINPTATPENDITYILTVMSKGGCLARDSVFVKVLQSPQIPNTFTPNNDNINDVWKIKYLETYPNCKVQVFTRTGQLVFESRGYKKPWDGTLRGKPLPVDTYYYIIEPENGRSPITGYVTIVK